MGNLDPWVPPPEPVAVPSLERKLTASEAADAARLYGRDDGGGGLCEGGRAHGEGQKREEEGEPHGWVTGQ